MNQVQTTSRRETKKRHTRSRIIDAARTLFVQQGYTSTSLIEISDAADIAERTLFTYFPGKSDILFAGYDEQVEDFMRAIEFRPNGQPATQAAISWHAAQRAIYAANGPTPDEAAWRRQLRRLIDADPALEAAERQRCSKGEHALAVGIARDLGSGPDDPRPRLIAATFLTIMFTAMKIAPDVRDKKSYAAFSNSIDEWLQAIALALKIRLG